MLKKKIGAALLAASVMALAAPATYAHSMGSVGAEKSDFSLAGLIGNRFGGPTGPVINTPGPKPPPR